MQEVKKPLRVSQADKCSFTELCPLPPPPLAILQTHLATLTNTCNNLDKYRQQIRQVYVTTLTSALSQNYSHLLHHHWPFYKYLTNTCNNLDKYMQQIRQIYVTTLTNALSRNYVRLQHHHRGHCHSYR